MADFQSSTHRARWIFTPEELAGKYKAANQRAMQTLEKYGATLMEVDVDGTLSYPKPQVNADARPKPISIEEEQFMRVFYENKLQEAKRYKFPSDKDLKHINRKTEVLLGSESKKRDKKSKRKSKRSSNEAQTLKLDTLLLLEFKQLEIPIVLTLRLVSG